MKRYCNNCGFENAEEDTFCMNCGTKLTEPKKEIRQPAKSVAQQPVKPVVQQPIEVQKPVKEPSEKRFVKSGKIVLTSSKTTTSLVAVAIVLSIIAIIFSVFVTPGLTLGAGSVDQQKLADNSVTSGKIVDGTISDSDINANGISRIADNSVGSSKIIDGSISMGDLAIDTINSLTGLNVIANNSINSSKIENFSITSDDLANSSITSQKILDGTITSADIGNGQVGYNQMGMKIKYSTTPASAYNGSSISHGISGTPTCVVVTPIYDQTSVYANATIIANVYGVGPSNFYVTLYYQYPGGSLTPVPSGSPVYVYWIAIY